MSSHIAAGRDVQLDTERAARPRRATKRSLIIRHDFSGSPNVRVSRPHGADRVKGVLARYLRTGTRSTQEALTYLNTRGIPTRIAARLVAEFRQARLLDDRTCARLCADHWARRGYSREAIRARLAQKQLGHRDIEAAVRALGDRSDELERAERFVTEQLRHRWRITGRPDASGSRQAAVRERARLTRQLALRGFELELIEQVVNNALGSRGDDAAER